MEKEKLTKELILNDIRYYQKHYTPKKSLRFNNLIIYISLFVILLAFIIIGSPFIFLSLLLPAAFFLITFLRKRKNTAKLSEKDFFVRTGKLESTREEIVNVGGKYSGYQTRVLLVFEDGNEWEIPYENYTWSKTFKMSRKGIDNTSLHGDTFYIVQLNDSSRIAAAYNQKFFDYQESKLFVRIF